MFTIIIPVKSLAQIDAESFYQYLRSLRGKNIATIVKVGDRSSKELQMSADVVLSGIDRNLWDAINQCIKYVKNDWVMIQGADDRLDSKEIDEVMKVLTASKTDCVSFAVRKSKNILKARGYPALKLKSAYMSNHSLGLFYKKKVHEIYGNYPVVLPRVGDQILLFPLLYKKKVAIYNSPLVIGTVGSEGITSDHFATAFEMVYALKHMKIISNFDRGILLILSCRRLIYISIKFYSRRT